MINLTVNFLYLEWPHAFYGYPLFRLKREILENGNNGPGSQCIMNHTTCVAKSINKHTSSPLKQRPLRLLASNY